MAQLDEQHRQIILKADEICKRLTPYTDYMVIMHDALMQMARFVEDLFAQSPWVSVEERYPENKYYYQHEDDKVLCKDTKDRKVICYWSPREQCWWGEGNSAKYLKGSITHWMKLPE